MRESLLDVDEGADMLMVKPARPYLDVIRAAAPTPPTVPIAAYQVSGEYAMLNAAAAAGALDAAAAIAGDAGRDPPRGRRHHHHLPAPIEVAEWLDS